MSSVPLRVLLVDDHQLLRDALKRLLEPLSDMQVVAEVPSVKSAIEETERCRPDLVIIDDWLSDGSGISAIKEIRTRSPATRFFMLTSSLDGETLFRAITAGVSGYALKTITGEDLVRGIRVVGQGQGHLDPAVTQLVLERLRVANPALQDERLAQLSAREEQILTLLVEGKKNCEIAGEVFLAEKTVKNYVSTIFRKLEVGHRAAAIDYMLKLHAAGPSRPTSESDSSQAYGKP